MLWFQNWWQGIGFVGQVMACAAIPTTIVLLLQTILMLLGVGFGGESDGFDGDGSEVDFDGDFDGDFGTDSDIIGDHGIHEGASDGVSDRGSDSESVRIITVRGVIAFFAIGGWAGLAALTAGVPTIWSVQIALIAGAAALLLASIVLRIALKMQSSGNINLRNAISCTADVYITIPPSRSGTGKVTMLLQERFVELDAVTDSESALRTNTKVDVVGVRDENCLVVSPVAQFEESE